MAGPLALLLSGLLSVFCFPSFNHGQLAWVAFVPFLLAVPKLRFKAALGWSFLAGGSAGIGVLYWIYPTCRWGGVNPAVSLLAVGGLSAHWGIFWLLFGGSLWCFSHRPRWEYPFWAAASWTVLEWLRGTLFSGFPWLPLACSQWQVPKHLPLAEIAGGYAISFLILLFNGALAAWIGVLNRPRQWAAAIPSVICLIGLTAWSVFLWRQPLPASADPVKIAVVQGNIDQYKKWDSSYEEEIVHIYATLTAQAEAKHPDLVVWPETAVPGWIPNDVRFSQWTQNMAKENRTHLLAGAVTHQDNNRDYNAAFLISPKGDFLGQYLKSHLVPFGEYVPLRGLLAPFIRAVNSLGSFDEGPGATVLTMPGAKLGVSICFEGLFPRLMARFAQNGAQILVNITNDGWYRHTAAPEQHFAASVLRAVENRRWVVRAANTGYSGFISPRGEIIGKTNLLEPAVLFGDPVPVSVLTFYTRHGDILVGACGLFCLGGLAFLFFKFKRNR